MSKFRVQVSRERVTLPNGRVAQLDIVHHPGAAAVVPFVSADDVLLIRQFRHAAGGTILEVPAGKIDPGDTPKSCAARELEEEAGRRAGRIEKLGWIFTTPGFTDEVIRLYVASELSVGESNLDADEFVEVLTFRFSEVLEMVRCGEIVDCKSVATILYAAQFVIGA